MFPRDGGEMGRAIREFDWASTALGPIDSWPVSLRTVVQMMLQQGHAICLVWGPDMNMLYNDAYKPFLGAKEHRALGTPFRIIWSDVWTEITPFINEAMSGRGTYSEDMRLVMDRNSYPEETFWTFSYSPLYDDDGTIAGLINVTVETTSVVQSRRAEELLRRELVHRVKNAMTVTTAVVSASMRNARSLEEARETIAQRVAALGRAQDLVHQSEMIDVATIVSSSMGAHLDDASRLRASGDPVELPPERALGLSLAVYELATNALKYGALSNTRGTIDIAWSRTDDGAFEFVWQEAGGPPVEAVGRSGFGSRLTNQIVASYFAGEGKTYYNVDGVRFELRGSLLHNEA